MPSTTPSAKRRTRRKIGIRKRLSGNSERPRLTIFRSGKHVYAQVIDDTQGKTLVSTSSLQLKADKGYGLDAASTVGKDIAEKATAAGVKTVAFDRNGYRYHGRIKAFADGAREGGLSF